MNEIRKEINERIINIYRKKIIVIIEQETQHQKVGKDCS